LLNWKTKKFYIFFLDLSKIEMLHYILFFNPSELWLLIYTYFIDDSIILYYCLFIMRSFASWALVNHHQQAPVFCSIDIFVKRKSHNLCIYIFKNMHPDTCVKHTVPLNKKHKLFVWPLQDSVMWREIQFIFELSAKFILYYINFVKLENQEILYFFLRSFKDWNASLYSIF
jgi:hypothetical protein